MYREYRAKLMVENDEGMTKTYNRFHDIYETGSADRGAARTARRHGPRRP